MLVAGISVLILKSFAQTERVIYAGDGFSTDISADGRVLVGWDFRNGDLVAFDARTHDETFRVRDHHPDEIASWAVASSDGSRIAYTLLNQEAYYDLRMITTTRGSSPRVLFADGSSREVQAFDWSPDNRHVLAALTYWSKPNELVDISTADRRRDVIQVFDGRAISGGCYFRDGSIAYAVQASRASLQEEVYVQGAVGRAPGLVATGVSPGSPVFCLDTGLAFVATRQNGRGLVFARRPSSGAWPEPRFVLDLTAGGEVLGILRDGTTCVRRPFELGSGPDVFIARLDPVTGHVLGAPTKANRLEDTSAREPSWGPDGKTITYWTSASGKPALVLKRSETTVSSLPFQPQGSLPWFPDGSTIAAASADGPNTRFNRIDVATGVATLIHRHEGLTRGQLALSPDGKQLFYVVRDNVRDRMILKSCSTSADDCHEVLSRSIPPAWPSWSLSPSGSKLAVIAYDDDHWRAAHIQIYDSLPGMPRDIYRRQAWVDGSKFAGITWSPDERWLYFVKPLHQSDGHSLMWRIAAAGGEPESIGISMRGLRAPAIDASGTQLLFEGPTTRLGRERLVLVPSDLAQATQARPSTAARPRDARERRREPPVRP
jgi:Tol biopolymer transport system component